MDQKKPECRYELIRRETDVRVSVPPTGKRMIWDGKNGCWRHGVVVGRSADGKLTIVSEVYFNFGAADLGMERCAVVGVEKKTLPDGRRFHLVTFTKMEGVPTKELELVDGVPPGAIRLLQNSRKSLVFRPIKAVAPTVQPQEAQVSA